MVTYASSSLKCIVYFRGTEPELARIRDEIKLTNIMTLDLGKEEVKTLADTAVFESRFWLTIEMKPSRVITKITKIRNRMRSKEIVTIQMNGVDKYEVVVETRQKKQLILSHHGEQRT